MYFCGLKPGKEGVNLAMHNCKSEVLNVSSRVQLGNGLRVIAVENKFSKRSQDTPPA